MLNKQYEPINASGQIDNDAVNPKTLLVQSKPLTN